MLCVACFSPTLNEVTRPMKALVRCCSVIYSLFFPVRDQELSRKWNINKHTAVNNIKVKKLSFVIIYYSLIPSYLHHNYNELMSWCIKTSLVMNLFVKSKNKTVFLHIITCTCTICSSCAAAAPKATGSERSADWSWTRPTPTSCRRSASRSEWEDFTCSSACIGVRRPRPQSRWGPGGSSRWRWGPGEWWSSSCWPQIHLALKDWADVKKFETDAVDAQHLDIVYIFRQLMSLKAFHFAATPVQVSSRHRRHACRLLTDLFRSRFLSCWQLSYNKKRKLEKSELCEDFIAQASRPQQLINIELLEVSSQRRHVKVCSLQTEKQRFYTHCLFVCLFVSGAVQHSRGLR